MSAVRLTFTGLLVGQQSEAVVAGTDRTRRRVTTVVVTSTVVLRTTVNLLLSCNHVDLLTYLLTYTDPSHAGNEHHCLDSTE